MSISRLQTPHVLITIPPSQLLTSSSAYEKGWGESTYIVFRFFPLECIMSVYMNDVYLTILYLAIIISVLSLFALQLKWLQWRTLWTSSGG